MRLRDPKLWLGGASLGLVLGLFAMDYEKTSPGPLSPSHGAVDRLVGKSGCDRCHGGWLDSLTDSCLECHAEIAEQLEAARGLHGAHIAREQGDEAARACGTCHAEHHGDQLPLAGAEAFDLAGLGERDGFDHRHVEFGLVGRHAELDCVRCHAQADSTLLADGELRFLGLEQGCTSCHEDPHQGRFTRGCESCHGQERPFGELESFTHGASFPLVGAHARPSCLECHPKDGEHEVEDLAGEGPPPPARTCQDCHDSPHRPGFTAEAARRLATGAGESCVACHDAERGPFAGDAAVLPLELHAASGFALERPHDQAACSDCHTATPGEELARGASAPTSALPVEAPAAFAARFPGRRADDCAACHADPHEGQFDREPYRRAGCLSCHERDTFEPPAFGIEEHARTGFPLDGSHTAVACSSCHLVEASPAQVARTFHGTPGACSSCHADAHVPAPAGEFAGPLARREELGGCAACHDTERFSQVERAAFDHLRWTAFALDGAHARAGCESCHVPRPEVAPDGRRFGRVAERFPGTPELCASCHADAHRGAFAAPGAGAQAPDCARCHVTEGFDAGEPIAGFDHGLWTDFPLEGAHARAECASCHGEAPGPAGGPLASPRSFGFVSERLGRAPGTCADCHEDPHRGRFDDPAASARGASCERCHTAESFADIDRAAFDHARLAGFELVGEHARAACEDCHAPVELPDRFGLRLGAARGSDCAACHVDPHVGQFASAGRTDCAACHLAERGFRELSFDHQRDARFPLDARHLGLACEACHVPWPLKSGERVVRYKPLGTECIDCHDPRRRGGGGQKRAGDGQGGLR